MMCSPPSRCIRWVGAWLRTEYDTAVIRAHAAADWQEFERNKDIFPNLRWMPTTSPEPESTHAAYWRMKLTLPVDDPFWNEHHPGDRWNCKCSLEATDEPVVRPADLEPTQPQRGLENNPGKDGHIFNDTHPYFPKNCYSCPFNKGFKNKVSSFFNGGEKDCHGCNKVNSKLPHANNIREELLALQGLKGREFAERVKAITERRDFKPVKGYKNIFCAGSTTDADYKPQLNAAKKAVGRGYTVYMLPNPKGNRTPDLILVRKEFYKVFDLKTISGKNSADNRLEESIGQANRVLLNMPAHYNSRKLALSIKDYFEINKEAQEVLIFKGQREMSVSKTDINKDFVSMFMRRYNK